MYGIVHHPAADTGPPPGRKPGSLTYRPGARRSPLAAKMFGVPVEMLRRAPIVGVPVAATTETPIAIHEDVAWARARRHGCHYHRGSDVHPKRNTRRSEHRAARQKQAR